MHPESEIAADFWAYVNHRGNGEVDQTDESFPSPPALMAELERQYWLIYEFKGEDADELKAYLVRGPNEGDAPVPWFAYAIHDGGYHLPPTAFFTLQDALYDYLLAEVGWTLIGKSYEIWVLSVAHILADVIRDSSRLTIPVRVRTGDNRVWDSCTEPHTMAISDDWDVLRRETFDFACRNYKVAMHDFEESLKAHREATEHHS